MIKFILTDIEGTTTSISFVHEVLFPYASQHLPEFVRTHQTEPKVAEILQAVADSWKEVNGDQEPDVEQLIQLMLTWIQEDRKFTPLKKLQGLMWANGYQNGDFKGHVYPDVPGALARWQAAGLQLGVYSSGSVGAQKLLYGYSEAGDLTPHFSAYFDTLVGHKREVKSYQKIAEELQLPPQEVLFLSDVPEELDAAESAGMQVRQLLRPGIPASDRHARVADFDALDELVMG